MMAEKYHAVTIEFGKNACEQVTRFAGKRFLSAEAPLLPLCALSTCKCRYHHHKDRRVDERREMYNGLNSTNWVHTERRKKRSDRRTAKEV